MTHPFRQLANLLMLVFLLVASRVSAQTEIQNPEFDEDMANWSFTDQSGPNYSNGGSTASVVQGAGLSGTNSLYIDVVNANNDNWPLSVRQLLNFDFETGKTYRISFVAKGQTLRDMDVAISGNGSNNNYWYLDLSLGTTPQTYSFYFECTDANVASEPSFSLSFYLAKGVISDVWLDKVSIEDFTDRTTGIEVTPTSLVVLPGQTWQLDGQVLPAEATNQNISWTSSDAGIATVSSTGVVTANSPGICAVTATSEDGGFTASTVVQVATPGETVVQNGEFNQGVMNWSFQDFTGPDYSNGGSGFSVVGDAGMSGSDALRVDIVNNNADAWPLRVSQALPFRLLEGRKYRVRFLAKSESASEVDITFSGNSSQLNYWYENADLTTTPLLFSYEFYCTDPDVANEASFSFNFYLAKGVISDVWLDKISIEDITGLVTAVEVAPTKVTLLAGQTWQLVENVEPYDAVNQNVTWSSSNTNVATVSTSGLVTAVSPGSASITVLTEDGGYFSTASISVPTPGVTPLTNGEFDLGTSGWTLEDESGPDFSNGGTTYAVVQGAGMSGPNALWVDIVNDNASSWQLRLSNALDFRLEPGKTYRVSFKAKAQSNRELHTTITGEGSQINYWYGSLDLTSSPQDYSLDFTCSDTGVLSEPSFSFNFYLALGVISDVWIDNVMIENITGKVTDIEISPSILTLKQGQTWTLSSEISPTNAINQSILWTSSNTDVASVNNAGLVTGISFGTATITATTVDGGYVSTSTITVAATGITSVQNPEFDLGLQGWALLDMTGPGYSNGGSGYSVVQDAGMSGSNALRVDIVNTNNENWQLQVIQQLPFRVEYGKTYRISFMAKGESARDMHVVLNGEGTHIGYWYQQLSLSTSVQTFTYDYTFDNTGVSSEPSFSLGFYLAQGVIQDVWIDKVSMQDISSVVAVSGISVSPASVTLLPGATTQLSRTITPSNATNQDVTWTSSNISVATVSGLGLVTAVSGGTATITATTLDGGFTSQSAITVQESQLAVGFSMAWNNLLGVKDDANYILTKTTTAGWANAGGISENLLPVAQNGWFEFKIDNSNTTSNYIAGFSLDNSYLRTSIEYGLEVSPSGNRILTHESADAGTDLSAWAIGDVFRISREGSLIKYYRNGIELRSIATDPNKGFRVKALINQGKTHLSKASFWIPASRGQVPDAWEFAALKDLYDSTSGPTWTNKSSWGSPNSWATNITSAQMNAWFGITVGGGDITRVDLGINNLVGKIPASISKLKSLRWLFLDYNHLTGSIPETIGTLTLLERLYLHRNSLTGDLPTSLGNLTRMQILAFHVNNLTGNFDWIGNLTNMTEFYFYANPNLNCTIPEGIGNLTKMTLLGGGGWVAQLDSGHVQTKIHGNIPSSLGNCVKLERLYLDNSELTGTVPDLSTIPNLRIISLFNNPALGGDLSEIVAGSANLQHIYTFNTNIGGNLPVINSTQIGGLDFSNSPTRGAVPNPPNSNTVEWLGFHSLELTSIPDWGTSYPGLHYLNVSNNLLTSIPNFSNHPNKGNLELYIQDNELDFADIEVNFTAVGAHPFKTFVYAPQRNPKPAPPYLTVMANEEIKIEAPSGGVHGVYLWEKKINDVWTNVNNLNQSGTPNFFVRSNGNETDEGVYRYTVSNSWIPGLVFQSGPIEVAIGDAHTTSARALYNGIITAMRWRTDKAYGVDGASDFEGMYVFDYDDKYQIEDASWAVPTENGLGFKNTFRLTGMQYDPNGNIMALKRYDENENRIHNFAYNYDYNASTPTYNNKLNSVAGYVNAYSYNDLGQLTGEEKENGENQYIVYDVSGKVRKVYANKNSSGEPIDIKAEYLYDDRGFRTAKLNFQDNRTTWYIRDASGNIVSIYEQPGVDSQTPEVVQSPVVETSSPLTPTEVPVYGSGKVGTYYPSQDGSMSYEIADHLGNVRALVRDDIMVFTATIEDSGDDEDPSNPRHQETNWFQNIEETEKDDPNMNHTLNNATVVSTPSRSAYLFWQNGVPGIEAADKAVGPAIALEVKEGDILTAKAFARYENKVGGYPRNGITLSVLSSLLGNSFNTMAGFEGKPLAEVNQLVNTALGAGAFLDDDDEGIPFAYINYIVFDAGMVRIDSKRQRISVDAGFDPPEAALQDQHEEVKFPEDITIGSGGKYIYLWVSNESEDTKVWFDDFTVTHASNFVAQATDYGIWGDVLREQRSTFVDKYRFGYQGQFAERDEETGWNHFELREYDAIVGRWTSKDPEGQYQSPYVGMGNNPVNGTDPNGGYFFGLFGSTRDQRQAARRDAELYGDKAFISDITSKNISVTYVGDPVMTSANFGERFLSTTYYNKDGSFQSYDISPITFTTLATGQADFDPLTQLTLGFAAVGGVSALGRVSFSTLAADVNYATTYAYVRGSSLIGQGVGYAGAGYFYAGYRLFGDKFTRLHPRLFTQTDIGHRAATFLRSDFLRQFPKVSNWNTIYWETSQGSGYFHIGVNPWTRTIFHEGYGHRPFGN